MHGLFSWLPAEGGALWAAIAALVALAAVAAMMLAVLRGTSGRGAAEVQVARLADAAERLAAGQAELAGRLQQAQAGLDQRLDSLGRRLGDGLLQQAERTGETLRALHERLALIDSARRTIAELTAQVTGLQDVLSDKQARGAFGEVQLESLVASLLPPGSYAFQATLSNRCRVDCLLRLPDPPGRLCVDAKFPLESFRAFRQAAEGEGRARASRAFAQDALRHVRDIAAKYILPGETADSALMFVPSEAVYAELHAGCREVVEEAFRRRVWIVSPTTLWATLNTVRAILRDVQVKQQAGLIAAALQAIAIDLRRLDERAAVLQRHFEQAAEDARQVRLIAGRLACRAAEIDLPGDAGATGGTARRDQMTDEPAPAA